MATDATGTPTTLGIPKYNPNVDAPSGLGFNAAMDAIDALIAGRMTAPTSPSSGDVPVWDGSAWVKSSTTKMAVGGIAPGSEGQVITTTGGASAWGAAPGDTRYRKTSEKEVINTITETDLLNGEITLAAGVLSTNKLMRLTVLGDYLNNSGALRSYTLKVKLGGTIILQLTVGNGADGISAAAGRAPLRLQYEVANLGAANSQFGFLQYQHGRNTLGVTTGIGGTFDRMDGTVGHQWVTNFAASNGTHAIDTSTSKLLEVTVTHSAANANLAARLKYALVEIV